MPVRRCVVPNCTCTSQYRFPNPLKQQALFKKWVEVIGNDTVANTDPTIVYAKYRLCGRHFDTHAVNNNNRLQRDALPKYHLPPGKQ